MGSATQVCCSLELLSLIAVPRKNILGSEFSTGVRASTQNDRSELELWAKNLLARFQCLTLVGVEVFLDAFVFIRNDRTVFNSLLVHAIFDLTSFDGVGP